MYLVKHSNPVETSFYLWINNYPQSEHPLDQRRFFIFVKAAYGFHRTKYKDRNFLKKQILKILPNCDLNWLEGKLDLFETLIAFQKTPKLRIWEDLQGEKEVKPDHYIERGIKKGEFYEKELIMPKI